MMATKRLAFNQIQNSPEIQEWLSQFNEKQRDSAQNLLPRLCFIDRDSFSEWLDAKIESYSSKVINTNKIGLYAVREFSKNEQLWIAKAQNSLRAQILSKVRFTLKSLPKRFYLMARALTKGNISLKPKGFLKTENPPRTEVAFRPPGALGSEDFIISIFKRLEQRIGIESGCSFYDHPSIETLRENKIQHIFLIDDSIGSGNRVRKYLERFLYQPTIQSWWNGGYLTFHIICYSRSENAEKKIIGSIIGAQNRRKRRKLENKILFSSEIKYEASFLKPRWGDNYEAIVDLCKSVTTIPKDRRLGYGKVMGNTLFYHSVPNNIPGILYISNDKWVPLFPNRVFPQWLKDLLDRDPRLLPYKLEGLSLFNDLLKEIKQGVHKVASLARALGVDELIVKDLLAETQRKGFINNKRITRAGINYLKTESGKTPLKNYDFSMYIPNFRCVGRATAQQYK